jgi:biogenesis of lysosome-related organelles complex 1 subunit 2
MSIDPVFSGAEEDAKHALSRYLQSEMRLQMESYEYLGELNEAAARNYNAIAQRGQQCLDTIEEIKNMQDEIQPALEQLQVLEDNISVLEKAAAKLDLYSEELLCRFKAIAQ